MCIRDRSYDGTEFSSTSGFGLGREMPGGGMGMGRPQEISSTEDSYNIPGLVIKTASDGSSDVEGMVTDKEAYSTAVKSSPYITMKIDSIYSRDSVINAINEAGYAVQDNSDFEIFGKIQSTLSKISIIFSISFIAVSYTHLDVYKRQGLSKPTKGKVLVEGKSVHSGSDNQLSKFRNEKMGFIFQNIYL